MCCGSGGDVTEGIFIFVFIVQEIDGALDAGSKAAAVFVRLLVVHRRTDVNKTDCYIGP